MTTAPNTATDNIRKVTLAQLYTVWEAMYALEPDADDADVTPVQWEDDDEMARVDALLCAICKHYHDTYGADAYAALQSEAHGLDLPQYK